jgi:hypothetical protein
MGALGHKPTLASRSGMFVLPPKADILSVEIDVCFVPSANFQGATPSHVALANPNYSPGPLVGESFLSPSLD